MNRIFRNAVLILICSLAVGCAERDYEFAALYEGLPFEMPKVYRPQIPSGEVCVTDFGAIGDGVVDNTEAFSKAIETLMAAGGGRLVVPEGIWLTGPIELKSNIELHLVRNSVLSFSENKSLYPLVDVNFGGSDMKRALSPIYAVGCHDIAITGEGVIDGNGQVWRPLHRYKINPYEWGEFLKKGGVVSEDGETWYPDQSCMDGERVADPVHKAKDSYDPWKIHTALRPVLIYFENCENVLLEGCTYQNSPCWTIHPVFCRNMIIKNIMVRSNYWAQNGDGIDVDACENVIISDCTFDVGDDALCIKSGKDADGWRHATPCKKVLIDKCTVYHGHGGFVIGSEMSGGVSDIKVSNCSFLGTDIGLRFKSTRGRGGVVENIWIDNIHMVDMLAEAVLFNLYYKGMSAATMQLKGGGHQVKNELFLVDETTPIFRNFHISNIICDGAKKAIYVNGLPEMPLENVEFRNCVISAQTGADLHHCKNIDFVNVQIHPSEGETFITSNAEYEILN